MKRIIDVSWPLKEGMTEWLNRKTLKIEKIKSLKKGHPSNSSHISFRAHIGTHIDAPLHFVDEGLSIEKIPLDQFHGKAKIIDFSDIKDRPIRKSDFEEKQVEIEKGDIILLKTINSSIPTTSEFNPNFVYADPEACEYLASFGIKLFGIDYLGVEPGFKVEHRERPCHLAFLKKNIPIVEGLRLEKVDPEKEYIFQALPLFFIGIEASPTRAVLFEM